MSVKINIDSQFLLREQDYPNGFTFEAHGKTVGDCLDQYLTTRPNLKKDFLNKWGKLDTNIHVLINKDDLTQAGLEKKVKDGDEVKIVYTRKTGC